MRLCFFPLSFSVLYSFFVHVKGLESYKVHTKRSYSPPQKHCWCSNRVFQTEGEKRCCSTAGMRKAKRFLNTKAAVGRIGAVIFIKRSLYTDSGA